jgi:hypothetical protein
MRNINFLCELTILIHHLPSFFRIAKAVSSTVKLVNTVTSDSVESINFVMSCKGAYAGARQYRNMVWYTVAHGRE